MIKVRMKKILKGGFSLVEILLALGILGVAGVGLMKFVDSANKGGTSVKEDMELTYLVNDFNAVFIKEDPATKKSFSKIIFEDDMDITNGGNWVSGGVDGVVARFENQLGQLSTHNLSNFLIKSIAYEGINSGSKLYDISYKVGSSDQYMKVRYGLLKIVVEKKNQNSSGAKQLIVPPLPLVCNFNIVDDKLNFCASDTNYLIPQERRATLLGGVSIGGVVHFPKYDNFQSEKNATSGPLTSAYNDNGTRNMNDPLFNAAVDGYAKKIVENHLKPATVIQYIPLNNSPLDAHDGVLCELDKLTAFLITKDSGGVSQTNFCKTPVSTSTSNLTLSYDFAETCACYRMKNYSATDLLKHCKARNCVEKINLCLSVNNNPADNFSAARKCFNDNESWEDLCQFSDMTNKASNCKDSGCWLSADIKWAEKITKCDKNQLDGECWEAKALHPDDAASVTKEDVSEWKKNNCTTHEGQDDDVADACWEADDIDVDFKVGNSWGTYGKRCSKDSGMCWYSEEISRDWKTKYPAESCQKIADFWSYVDYKVILNTAAGCTIDYSRCGSGPNSDNTFCGQDSSKCGWGKQPICGELISGGGCTIEVVESSVNPSDIDLVNGNSVVADGHYDWVKATASANYKGVADLPGCWHSILSASDKRTICKNHNATTSGISCWDLVEDGVVNAGMADDVAALDGYYIELDSAKQILRYKPITSDWKKAACHLNDPSCWTYKNVSIDTKRKLVGEDTFERCTPNGVKDINAKDVCNAHCISQSKSLPFGATSIEHTYNGVKCIWYKDAYDWSCSDVVGNKIYESDIDSGPGGA